MKGFVWSEKEPPYELIKYDYNTIKNGGIDTLYVNWDNESVREDGLRRAAEAGIKIILTSWTEFMPYTWKNGTFDTEKFKKAMNNPDVIAFNLGDEPALDAHDELRQYYLFIKSLTDKPVWLNLFPNFMHSKVGSDYAKYVETFQDCCDITGADFYPVTNNDVWKVKDWYNYLEFWRTFKTNKPKWLWFCTSSHLRYPVLTLESLRLQTNANLMFGADDCICYCYSDRPEPSEVEGEYKGSPLDRVGNIQDAYYIVKDYMPTYNTRAEQFRDLRITSTVRRALWWNPFSKICFTSQRNLYIANIDDGSMLILNVSAKKKANIKIRKGLFKYDSIQIEPGDIASIK